MSNPLNSGVGGGVQMFGNVPVPANIMQTINQVVGMIQGGTDIYTVIKALKSKNITPQAVERGLYLVMPELRSIKQKMGAMGINPKEIIGQVMKENNIDENDVRSMIGDLVGVLKKGKAK